MAPMRTPINANGSSTPAAMAAVLELCLGAASIGVKTGGGVPADSGRLLHSGNMYEANCVQRDLIPKINVCKNKQFGLV